MKIGIAGPVLIDSFKDFLHLPKSYPKGLGGSNVINLIIGLLKLNKTVSVYTLDVSVKELVILEGEHLKIYIGEYRERGRDKMLDLFRKEWKQIEQFIKLDKPDIVNAHWGYEFAIGTIKSGYPHLITLHDVPIEILKLKKDLYRLIRLIMNYWVMKNGKHFSANSPYTAEKLKGFKKFLPIIPNSISSEYLSSHPKNYPNNKIRIVSLLSGWGEIKNPQPALKAFSLIRKKFGDKVEYHLFGTGYEKDGDGFSWAKENHLLDGVFFNGLKTYHEMMRLLSDYDILLHPSKEESFGMTLIEAMAKGLPVIAGKNSGAVPWLLNYGECGILVDVTSSSEIMNAIQNLINDKMLYEKLSVDGFRYINANFLDINVASKLLEIMKDIIQL